MAVGRRQKCSRCAREVTLWLNGVALVAFVGPGARFGLQLEKFYVTIATSASAPVGPLVCDHQETHWFSDADCPKFTSQEACAWHRSHNVWLASYPGSGNTWLRHLLHRATGVHTGSVYRDSTLLKVGYLGESVKDPARVLGVKLHAPALGHPTPNASNGTSLVLVRHPLWAILAYISWRTGGHSKLSSDDDLYTQMACRKFSQLRSMAREWRLHTEFWLNAFPEGSRRFVRYEDLQARPEQTLLSEVLPYLGVDATNPDIIRAVRCELENSTQPASTKRVRARPFRFTTETLKIVEDAVGPLMLRFNYSMAGVELREPPAELHCCDRGPMPFLGRDGFGCIGPRR